MQLADIDNSLAPIPAAGIKIERAPRGRAWQMGDKVYTESLEYTSGIVMLKAWAHKFSTTGEDLSEGFVNHCHVNFPGTTHVIKILFSGGVTKNGVWSLLPSDTQIFQVIRTGGDAIPAGSFLGLADLGQETNK